MGACCVSYSEQHHPRQQCMGACCVLYEELSPPTSPLTSPHSHLFNSCCGRSLMKSLPPAARPASSPSSMSTGGWGSGRRWYSVAALRSSLVVLPRPRLAWQASRPASTGGEKRGRASARNCGGGRGGAAARGGGGQGGLVGRSGVRHRPGSVGVGGEGGGSGWVSGWRRRG
jgi:hypothetical protein